MFLSFLFGSNLINEQNLAFCVYNLVKVHIACCCRSIEWLKEPLRKMTLRCLVVEVIILGRYCGTPQTYWFHCKLRNEGSYFLQVNACFYTQNVFTLTEFVKLSSIVDMEVCSTKVKWQITMKVTFTINRFIFLFKTVTTKLLLTNKQKTWEWVMTDKRLLVRTGAKKLIS